MTEFRIIRTVTVIVTVPYEDTFYPGYSLEEAISLEKQADNLDAPDYDNTWMETFFENKIIKVETTVEVTKND